MQGVGLSSEIQAPGALWKSQKGRTRLIFNILLSTPDPFPSSVRRGTALQTIPFIFLKAVLVGLLEILLIHVWGLFVACAKHFTQKTSALKTAAFWTLTC